MKTRAARGREGVWVSVDGEARFLIDDAACAASPSATIPGGVASPMPGKVVKMFVKAGERVKAGAPLAAIEAMKMEYLVKAPSDGRVRRVLKAAGAQAAPGEPLVDWEPS